MLNLVLDAAGVVLLAVVIVHSAVLHLRIGRLKRALAEAGNVLPALDEAVDRMNDLAGGFARRMQGELETVEVRIATARRVATDLSTASRGAEELANQLERQVRQSRKLEGARAAALPRELVEPKGFAANGFSDRGPAPVAPAAIPALPAAPPPLLQAVERVVRVNMLPAGA
jgi:hypothetical protein